MDGHVSPQGKNDVNRAEEGCEDSGGVWDDTMLLKVRNFTCYYYI